jgi:cytoskeletal protein RodZ
VSGTFVDFGRYLSQQRQLKGLSRDDIAKATRIPPTLVAALEDGLMERMPESVFVLNYVRSYAAAVGLSADDAVNRFHEIPGTLLPTEQSPVTLEAARQKKALVVLAAVVAVIVVLGIALYVWTQAQLAAQAPR